MVKAATLNTKKRSSAGQSNVPPTHLKYPKYDTSSTTEGLRRTKPSMMMDELQNGPKIPSKHPPPKTIEFLNLEDYTAQVNSVVPLDEPLFQPYPMEVVFQDYEPFGTYEQTLYMRNNDTVARRVKIKPPDSAYFEVSGARSAKKNQPLTDGKIAAGMEVCFVVKFKPQERRSYGIDLVVSTEREKFLVPVKALGTRAVLNFPDEVVFEVSPVKARTRRTLMVRNLGTQASDIVLSCTGPFSATPRTAHVRVGDSLQVELTFLPPYATDYEGELEVQYEDGSTAQVRLLGSAENVDVQLGQPTVQLEPAYISLSSQKTVRVFNRSDTPVQFSWKAFAVDVEEEAERGRLKQELDSMEEMELAALEDQLFSEDDSDASLSEDEFGGAPAPAAKRTELALLRRKYKNLRKAVDSDQMLFADVNFFMEPSTGEIWANSEVEVTITFRPQTAADYACTAFLDVTGRDSRLPLLFTGKGIGPKAALSYDVLDIGDVFVNSVHRYEVSMANRGDIEAHYEMMPSPTPFGPKFQFLPSRGTLGVGESHTLEITFSSDILGEFSEQFSFKLRGSDEPLSVHFKGHVIGPTFHFDTEEIDFGRVSYSFLHTKTAHLHNTSEIPMRFTLRVPDDGAAVYKEFDIIPSSGTVLPGGRQKIQLDFISTTVKEYSYFLSVDIEGVGEGLLSLPIRGVCEVPAVVLVTDELTYGDCFMRYPYVQKLTLVNQSRDLQAKYEVLVQDEHSQAVAVYSAEPFKGSIPPMSERSVDIKLVCEKLGSIRLPLYVKVAGSTKPPLLSTVCAASIGPVVRLSKEELNWGPSVCLQEHTRTLTMTNDSLIPAPFKTFIKNPRSKFRVSVPDGVLGPGETLQLVLTAKLDDTTAHRDQMHIIVAEGRNLLVPLAARGTGTTMWCQDDLAQLDFGFQFTNRTCERKVTLENRGRRTQTLAWVNRTVKDREAELKRIKAGRKVEESTSGAGAGGRGSKAKALQPIVQVFSVVPDAIELRPHTACTFTFRGASLKRGFVSELLALESKVGTDKTPKTIYSTDVKSEFINPLLEPSCKSLSFNYTYLKDVPICFQSQPLTLKNRSELPLTFVLRTAVPFSVDTWECSLAPAESVTINVEFDPGYQDDRKSQTVNGKLTAVYRDHPQKDAFDLFGEINFPNLNFEFNQVDFGCIMNDTTKSMVMKVSNPSSVDCAFEWSFCQEDEDRMGVVAVAGAGTTGVKQRSTVVGAGGGGGGADQQPIIPINQVFDVLPIRSYLQPGEVEEVEFIFYGHAGRRFKGMVVAEVEGGPDYELRLRGEASTVGFKLDRHFLDFGKQQHNKSEEKEFYLLNTGKVAYPFQIRLDQVSRPGVVTVHPTSGRVHANDRQRVSLRFKPGLPDRVLERLVLELGHFEPVEFPIYGHGTYASVVVSLPRKPVEVVEDEEGSGGGGGGSGGGGVGDDADLFLTWPELLEEARRRLENPQEMLLLMPPAPESVNSDGTVSRPVSRMSAGPAKTQRSETPTPGSAAGGGSSPGGTATTPAGRGGVGAAESQAAGGVDAGGGVTRIPSQETVASSTTKSLAGARARQSEAALQLEIETEANRLYYLQHLRRLERQSLSKLSPLEQSIVGTMRPPTQLPQGQREGEDGLELGSGGLDASKPPVPPLPLQLQLGADTVATGGGKKVVPPLAPPSTSTYARKKRPAPKFVIATHMCDFGNVVLGTHRKKVFRVTNTGYAPVSFLLDKALALSRGFLIEPERVNRLPENESVEFSVTFNAKKHIDLGNVVVDLPLDIKNGPITTISLQAFVTVPDVRVSSETLDFGEVLVGRSRVIHVQLENVAPVVTEWSFKRHLTPSDDVSNFTMTPRQATLQPGERVNVSIEFTPTESRAFGMNVPIKVNSNSMKPHSLSCRGAGCAPCIGFDPPLAQLGPVLPHAPPVEKIVYLINESDYEMEVYSSDFDAQYLEEERVLRRAKGYGSEDFMRLPLRAPGAKLPAVILEEEAKMAETEALKVAVVEREAEFERNLALRIEAGELDEVEAEAERARFEEKEEGLKAQVAEVVAEASLPPTARGRGEHYDQVLIGPPLSGVSTQSRRLVEKFQYGRFTLDEMVERVRKEMTPLGKRVRTSLNLLTAEEAEEKNAALYAQRSTKKRNPRVEEATEEQPHFMDHDLLVTVLRWLLSKPDFGNGAVLERLDCSYVTSPVDAAAAVAEAMPDAQLVVFSVDREVYQTRIGALKDRLQGLVDTPLPTAESQRRGLTGVGDAPGSGGGSLISEGGVGGIPPGSASGGGGDSVSRGGTGNRQGSGGAGGSAGMVDGKVDLSAFAGGDAMELEGEQPGDVAHEEEGFVELSTDAVEGLGEDERRQYEAQKAIRDARLLRQQEGADFSRVLETAARNREAAKKVLARVQVVEDMVGFDSWAEVEQAVVAKFKPILKENAEGGGDGEEGGGSVGSGDGKGGSTVEEEGGQGQLQGQGRSVMSNDSISASVNPVTSTEDMEVEGEGGEATLGDEAGAEAGGEEMVEGDGGQDKSASVSRVFVIPVVEEDDEVTIGNAVIAAIPNPETKQDPPLLIPPPVTYQLVRRPAERGPRIPPKYFKILRMDEKKSEVEEEDWEEEAAVAMRQQPRGSPDVRPGSRNAQLEEEEEVVEEEPPVMRWILPRNSTTPFVVQFASTDVGRFDCALRFEIVGGSRSYNLLCQGVCTVPTINSDPRNVFMNRVKARPPQGQVQKKYVASQSTFEFGPLLVGKTCALMDPQAKGHQLTRRSNAETFRITNNGRLPTRIHFTFEKDGPSEIPGGDGSGAGGAGGAADSLSKKGASSDLNATFLVVPSFLELAEGQTDDITVWAFPPEPGAYQDALVACIENNPNPVRFAVSCLGEKPGLKLNGPWDVAIDAALAAVEALPEETLEVERRQALEQVQVLRDQPLVIDFSRLLLGRSEEKEFQLGNTATIPVAWRLDLAALESAPDFQLNPTEGVLQPGESTTVTVTFTASTESDFSREVIVQYSDTEGGLEESQAAVGGGGGGGGAGAGGDVEVKKAVSITLKAEAYRIDVLSFEESRDPKEAGRYATDGVLNFDVVRVGDYVQRRFIMRNRGKYDVTFSLAVRRAATRALFTIDPPDGRIAREQSCVVTVTFCTDREVRLKDNKDIRCTIMEARTGEVYDHFDVCVNVRSVFSKFRLQPLRGINFSAVGFNEDERSRKLELRNDGEFPFTFVINTPDNALNLINSLVKKPENPLLVGMGGMVPPSPSPSGSHNKEGKEKEKKGGEEKEKKGGDKKKGSGHGSDEVVLGSPLPMGQFTIDPQGGTLQPGTVATVQIRFKPEGAQLYREHLSIEVSGRDLNDPLGSSSLEYELVGESCFPGINTTDFSSIFEEQAVVRSLAKQLDDSQRVVFAEEERRFTFGAVVPSTHLKGVSEKIKISNPNKVRANVNFQIKSLADSNSSQAQAEAYTIQPSSWDIPSHEHRYVTVYFQPTAMLTYNALFSAEVEGGADPATNKLEFELTGSGTLPCLTVEKPSKLTPEGELLLEFGRIQVGKARQLPLVLRNDGIVSATCVFKMDKNPSFSFTNRGGSVAFESRTTDTFFASFQPVEEGPLSTRLRLQVRNNEYETKVVSLVGTGYVEDVTFEDMPEGADDELVFEEQDLATEGAKQVRFSLKNHSASIIRFDWGAHTDFKFEPSVGHLLPHTSKSVTASFQSTTPATHQQVPIPFTFVKVTYKEGEEDGSAAVEARDWDDTMKTVRYVSQEELDAEQEAKEGGGVKKKGAAAKKETLRKGGKDEKAKAASGEEGGEERMTPKNSPIMVTEVAPEPPVEVSGEEKVVNLKCSAVADRLSYRCDTTSVSFRPTTMFQTRSFKFPVTNSSRTQLAYTWGIEKNAAAAMAAFTYRGPAVPCPFTVEPSSGVIPAGEFTDFVVRFNPVEVDDFRYELSCNMANLPADVEPLVVPVFGRALRPVCHFDLATSDYAQRRPPGLPGPDGQLGPLDPGIRVVEFESLGTRVRNTRRFHVLNPMNVSYEFAWETVGVPNAHFRCVSNRGLMLAGKRCEMVFEFTPETVSIQEAFFRFTIPSQGVSELFVLSGRVAEPDVTLERTKVDFAQLLLGSHTSETVNLVNREHIPFSFHFDRASFDFPGGAVGDRPVVSITPVSGTIPPNGSFPVEVNFRPTEEKGYNLNLVCVIRKKPTKLGLNVKGEGYAVHDRLVLEDEGPGGEPISLDLSATSGNYLDFGTVHINEKKVKAVTLYNSGQITFDYTWSRHKNPMFTVTPETGRVGKGERVPCRLEFHPKSETSLDQTQLVCTVAGTRHYPIALAGRGVQPALNLSFLSHDFGPCFITTPGVGVQAEEAVLRISNAEAEADISFDCLYEKTNQLEVKCAPTVLGPGEAVEVPILFIAREIRRYSEVVPFLINGNTTVNVVVKGEGCVARVELAHPGQATLNFGSIPAGGDATKVVKLVNRSKRTVAFELVDPVVAGRGRLEELGVTFFPNRETQLRPREAVSVEIKFHPYQRVPLFEEEVLMRLAGETKRLLTVSGQSQGLEVRLETDTLPFGGVCERSRMTRKVQMENTGDVVAKFSWDTAMFGPDFSISPTEGFLAPYSDIKFDVVFHPRREEEDIRYEGLRCYLEGGEPLFLTLTGSCVPQPSDAVRELKFTSAVRDSSKQQVTVKNPTDGPWRILPVLSGEHWSVVEESLDVPSKGSADLTVVYHPVSMTNKGGGAGGDAASEAEEGAGDGLHHGSVFLALPDGKALLYNLVGTASEPAVAGSINLTTPAKKAQPISLPLVNWLKSAQRFEVAIQLENKAESTFVDGATTIDLPGGGARDYNMRFYAYKEGSTSGKVTFNNPITGEYVVYNLSVTATEPGILEEIELDAPVRQPVRKVITMENPLPPDQPVTFPTDWWSCDDPNVRVKQLGDMSGQKEGAFEVEYRPLVARDNLSRRLTLRCNELGTYSYRLKLNAGRSSTDRNLLFTAALGGTQVHSFRFRSYVTSAIEYECKVSDPLFFHVPAKIKAEPAPGWEGVDVVVQVTFEPEALGESRDTLVVKHPEGGTYSCALQGRCTAPLPQGPFTIARGGSVDIPLKNVFAESREFVFAADDPQFVVASRTLTIPAKSAKSVSVKFTPGASSAGAGGGAGGTPSASPSGNTGAVAGKIFVSCPALPDMPAWVFYLQGAGES